MLFFHVTPSELPIDSGLRPRNKDAKSGSQRCTTTSFSARLVKRANFDDLDDVVEGWARVQRDFGERLVQRSY